MPRSFSARLLAWYAREGRHDLPWQTDRSPYRTWVSETMLQQTQVETVIPYFERFTRKFPTPAALASASLDEVLGYWAGLGYYARARNLHRAAREVCERFDGALPQRYEELVALPGIGRSTAGAILALCFGQPFPILDGNVKRVLARHANVKGWPGKAAVARRLWVLSEERLPPERGKRIGAYTQAIMDLGSMVCTRMQPRCDECPVSADCKARIAGCIAECPGRRPRRSKPERSTVMLIVTYGDRVLLRKRPASGVWGGLLCPPEIERADDASGWCRHRLGREAEVTCWDGLVHEFTHFKLHISPVAVELRHIPRQVREGDDLVWCKMPLADGVGVPAPVRKLLARLEQTRTNSRGDPQWRVPSIA